MSKSKVAKRQGCKTPIYTSCSLESFSVANAETALYIALAPMIHQAIGKELSYG